MSQKCELVLDYFNGHLTQTEREEFEQHLATCSECQEELMELEDLLGDVALVSEQASPPPEMKKRILNNVFAEDVNSENVLVTPIASKKEVVDEPFNKTTASRKPWLTTLLAASLLLSLIGNGYLMLQNEESSDLAAEELKQPDNVVTLQPSDAAGSGFAALFQQEQALSVMIQTQDLPELSGSEVYQVWLLKDGSPIPAGDFTIDNQGKGYVFHNIEQTALEDWDTIAITLEPQSGNELPEGEIHLSAGL
ncbi:anti-sigma factor [Sutcliffiella horikoshii]|uniref:Anti-sigma-W factor RsiW n=1 Tax=Sutcliffiella horikoshii TaxID=79883 RepID=A0AA94WP68_9BACI|nr:anti-sigma factor [Sutcliffiella horikoshii]TYS55438.1 anti-sigma factor [Sutcliffiella horikoshii]